MKKIILTLLTLFFYSLPTFAYVSSKTNTISVPENQTFQLEIVSDSASSRPDLAPLDADFDVLGDKSSKSVSFINGQMRSEQKIVLVLKPKRTGVLTVPSIVWGGEKTQPIQIEVLKASDSIKMKNETALFIDAQVLSDKIYEGAGFVYRVQVLERVGLVDGAFTAPQLDGAQVIPLGQPVLSQIQKDNVLYQGLTQDYVIFPETAGSKTILPAMFQGYYQDALDPFQSFGMMDSFIYRPNSHKEIMVRAKPVQIEVLPRPESAKNKWWLPSSDVTISQKLEGTENATVGQPLSRQIELTALGVLGNMLPDVDMSGNQDFKVYAEEPKKTQVYEDNIGLIGKENRTFVVVPLKSGQLKLPPISVHWFDVDAGKMKTAQLDGVTVSVAPDVNAPVEQKVTPQMSQNEPRTEDTKLKNTDYLKENNLLYFMFGLCAGLFLGMIGILVVHRMKYKKSKLPEFYPQNK